jgi:alanyl aminopeptidase
MTLKCDGAGPRIEMEQERFLPLGSVDAEAHSWKVPVCVAYDNGGKRATECTTLEAKVGTLALKSKGCPAWFLGNADEAGYYYTRYEGPVLMKLAENRGTLTLAEQAGLFGELDNVMRAGRLPVSIGLKLAVQLKDEPKRQIAESAIQFAGVRLAFLPVNLRPKYAQYVRENFGPRARRLGWVPRDGESEDDRLLRPGLVGFVARDGQDPELIASALELTNKWLDTRQALPADTFNGIFDVAGRNGDLALYEKILKVAKSEKDEFFLQTLVSALGSFRDTKLVARNQKLLLDGTFDVRMSFNLLFGPTSFPELARLPLEFVEANYDALLAKLPTAAGSDYAAYLPETANFACSTEEAKQVQEFFGPRMAKVNGGPRNLAQVLESIRLCEARKKIQQPDLIQYFESR